MAKVSVTADHNRVGLGNSVTLTCSVSDPEASKRNYTYLWWYEDALFNNKKSSSPTISFSVQDFGTYVCEVLTAGVVRRGHVVLEEGGKLLARVTVFVCLFIYFVGVS